MLDEIKATFDNGILKLTVPKAEPDASTKRKVEIE